MSNNNELAARLRDLAYMYPNASQAALDLYTAADIIDTIRISKIIETNPKFTQGTKPYEEIRNLVDRSFGNGEW